MTRWSPGRSSGGSESCATTWRGPVPRRRCCTCRWVCPTILRLGLKKERRWFELVAPSSALHTRCEQESVAAGARCRCVTRESESGEEGRVRPTRPRGRGPVGSWGCAGERVTAIYDLSRVFRDVRGGGYLFRGARRSGSHDAPARAVIQPPRAATARDRGAPAEDVRRRTRRGRLS